MGKHTDQRDRTLCLARILYEETDEKHPMPMTEMIRRLEEEGVASERKSIYRDLAAMNKQGFEVAYRHGKTGGWYLAGRPLNLSELQTVIDAVAVYRWIPAALRASLLDKLAGLFPRGQRGQLRRPVSLPPQGVTAPEEVRQVLDRVHTALQSQRALRFVSRRGDGFSRSTLWWSAPRGCCGLRRGITCWGGTIEANRWPSIARIGCLRCWSRECPRRGPIPTRHCGPQPPSASSPTGGSGCGFAAAALWRMKSSTVWGQQSS